MSLNFAVRQSSVKTAKIRPLQISRAYGIRENSTVAKFTGIKLSN